MAGGGLSGLTNQTLCVPFYGSDTISSRNPARPHTSDRYMSFSNKDSEMRLVAKYNNLTFEIVEDKPEVGFYLYVYDNQNKCIKDYLQDTEQMIKELAFEKFSVPLDSWTADDFVSKHSA
jgi:hypothetical protein